MHAESRGIYLSAALNVPEALLRILAEEGEQMETLQAGGYFHQTSADTCSLLHSHSRSPEDLAPGWTAGFNFLTSFLIFDSVYVDALTLSTTEREDPDRK